jgi:hypothetical protein
LFEKELPNRSEDILIYLHCNSGCRLEGKRWITSGFTYLKLAIEHDFSYLLFDFSGSGLSEGKYVSLGRVGFIQQFRILLGLRSINYH